MNRKIMFIALSCIFGSISNTLSPEIKQALHERDIRQAAKELARSNEITTTSRIAQKLGYRKLINQLLNKGRNVLDRAESRHQGRLLEFRAQNRLRAAQESTDEFRDVYTGVDNRLDSAAQAADRMLILEGRRLDDINAPIEDKIKLVLQAKDIARRGINRELEQAAETRV